ncbi:response regulator transcription factor [Limibacter armeniacum]|uniref:response regulator transcription factor n=1 Tax=Limibacter armeniacum TaxID=466084 RepID=UPI002FE6BCC6
MTDNYKTIKVMIADDHRMFIQGLRSLLEEEVSIEIVGEAYNGKHTLDQVGKTDFDVLIVDISMPDMDGIEVTRKALEIKPDIKILGLSMHNEKRFISNLLKTGALGYVLKNTDKEELVYAINQTFNGENYLSDDASKTLVNSFIKTRSKEYLNDSLSEREMDVLKDIANGYTTQQIAERLFISKNTVETHRKNLLLKMKAKNTAELVNVAFKEGIIN